MPRPSIKLPGRPPPPRRTQIEAYRIIEESGLLTKARWAVYAALHAHGPATAGELQRHVPNMRHAAVSARLTDLVDWQVACELGDRKCRVTGFNVIEFQVTSKLPVPPPKKKSKLKLLRDENLSLKSELRDLQKENMQLRQQLHRRK